MPHSPSAIVQRSLCLLSQCDPLTSSFSFFFFNDTATTEIYTLSLHDALPISEPPPTGIQPMPARCWWEAVPQSWQRRSAWRSEEHTSALQSPDHLVCRLLLEKKKIESLGQHGQTIED